MAKELTLRGKGVSNFIGAVGEIIAWDTLRKMGIWTYKIGSWKFFPEGYPYWRGEFMFLTRKQVEFVKYKERGNILEFDFVGAKCQGVARDLNSSVLHFHVVEAVYLIEVKAGRGAKIRYYAKNPMRAFNPENLKKAKAIGFKVALVVVELLDNWKCRITYREL
jgi:hypothetical protein